MYKSSDKPNLKFSIQGRIDTNTSPELDKAVNESIDGVTNLIFDFEKVEYISSAGLRVLLSAQKKMNKQGTMKVINVGDAIMEIFNVLCSYDFWWGCISNFEGGVKYENRYFYRSI